LYRSEQILSLFTYQKAQTIWRGGFFPYGQENGERNLLKKSTIKIRLNHQESSPPQIFIIYLAASNPIAA
jgi:hypothetical protein